MKQKTWVYHSIINHGRHVEHTENIPKPFSQSVLRREGSHMKISPEQEANFLSDSKLSLEGI